MAKIVRGNASAAVTQTTTGQDYPAAQAVAITDGDGGLMTLTGGTLPVSSGSGPSTSLNAATATGPGAVIDLGVVRSSHTLQTTVTGSPTGVTVNLEGSLTATGPWTTLATSTSTTGDVQTATGKAVRYVRANLTVLTAGTSPTVTALIASAQ
ncbi:hypothetical protein [Actinocrinis sp.]|uniref:hypothetical protein n=1 Tax=Actinocrinis sp. TaxID=1920516 RepID=UPI002D6D19B1|nr:hypothetical protein [Actinocrinis sp.]HZP55041.1 hypothetical protein [Actinocrinis sp.]